MSPQNRMISTFTTNAWPGSHAEEDGFGAHLKRRFFLGEHGTQRDDRKQSSDKRSLPPFILSSSS